MIRKGRHKVRKGEAQVPQVYTQKQMEAPESDNVHASTYHKTQQAVEKQEGLIRIKHNM